jgi:hypothetical protein
MTVTVDQRIPDLVRLTEASAMLGLVAVWKQRAAK